MPYLMGEHNIHDSLVGGVSVLKLETRDIVVVVSMIQHRGCFANVQWVHMNLVIPWVCIHEAQHVVAWGSINKADDGWQCVLISADDVNIDEVYIHALYVVIFLYYNYIGSPSRVFCFRDEPDVRQFPYLFINGAICCYIFILEPYWPSK